MGGRALLMIAALSLGGASARAQEAASFLGGEPVRSSSIAFESLSQAAPAGDAGLWVEEEKLNLVTPVVSEGESNVAVLVRGQRTRFSRDLAFPEKGLVAPSDFGLVELGVNWSHRRDERSRWGAVALYGSSGPRLFTEGSTPLWNANAFLEHKVDEGSSWLYFVNISNSRSRWNNIPIPGFAYLRTTATSRLVLGLPFIFAMWRPDPWMFTMNLSPFSLTAEAAYRMWGPLQVFTGVGWVPRAYLNLIPDSDERLIFDRKEANVGARLSMGPKGSLSVAYVKNIGRRLFLGSSLTDAHSEVLPLADSGGVQVRGRLSF